MSEIIDLRNLGRHEGEISAGSDHSSVGRMTAFGAAAMNGVGIGVHLDEIDGVVDADATRCFSVSFSGLNRSQINTLLVSARGGSRQQLLDALRNTAYQQRDSYGLDDDAGETVIEGMTRNEMQFVTGRGPTAQMQQQIAERANALLGSQLPALPYEEGNS